MNEDYAFGPKGLEQGRLVSNCDQIATCEMDWITLKCLLEGIAPQRVKRRYRHALGMTNMMP